MHIVEWFTRLIKAKEGLLFKKDLEEYVNTMAGATKYSFLTPMFYKQMMEDVGFEDIKEVRHELPMNSWPKEKLQKEIGICTLLFLDLTLERHAMRAMTRNGMTKEEVIALACAARKDLRNRRIHGYIPG